MARTEMAAAAAVALLMGCGGSAGPPASLYVEMIEDGPTPDSFRTSVYLKDAQNHPTKGSGTLVLTVSEHAPTDSSGPGTPVCSARVPMAAAQFVQDDPTYFVARGTFTPPCGHAAYAHTRDVAVTLAVGSQTIRGVAGAPTSQNGPATPPPPALPVAPPGDFRVDPWPVALTVPDATRAPQDPQDPDATVVHTADCTVRVNCSPVDSSVGTLSPAFFRSSLVSTGATFSRDETTADRWRLVYRTTDAAERYSVHMGFVAGGQACLCRAGFPTEAPARCAARVCDTIHPLQ